jgi:hypothetical protein
MNVFAFVISVVAIVMTANTIQTIYKIRSAKSARDDDAGSAQEQLDTLEERIRVLERIVTEKNYDLKREIDSL